MKARSHRTNFFPVHPAQESQRSRAGTLERPQSIDVASHAESLRDRGFTVLSKNCVDAAVIQSARELSRNTLATLLDKVKAAGCDPFEQQYRFKEIASRQRYRWDLQLQDPAQGLDDSTSATHGVSLDGFS